MNREKAAIETFIFSYGRGRYLENCLQSLAKVGWEGPITIFDDGSRDRASRHALESAERSGIRVERRATRVQGIWGGLQANMGSALEIAQGPLALFLQDDTQVVRCPSRAEIVRLHAFLSDERNSPFLFPSFQMQSWGAQNKPHLYRFDADAGMWFRTAEHRFAGFSDVSLFHVGRLRSSGWDTSFVEKEAASRAMELFGPMAISPYPFVAFLPYPHTPRRGLRYRVKQPKRFRRPASILPLSDEQAVEFMERDPSELPFASQALRLESRFRQWIIGSYWSH